MSHKKMEVLTVKGCRWEKIKPKKYLAQTPFDDIAELGLSNFFSPDRATYKRKKVYVSKAEDLLN